jgi:hypothetical protein
MGLMTAFVDCAERQYAIDWGEIQRLVAARLDLAPADRDVLDPRRHPTYWCVPILVGSYVGASADAVRRDLVGYVGGCAIHHLLFETGRSFGTDVDREVLQAVADAYRNCRLDGAPTPFDARFSAKCQPWTVLLLVGTRAIVAEMGGDQGDYTAAMAAIVLVYSLLQMVDDWHDRDEDRARGHWNMWTDPPAGEPLTAVAPLLRASRDAVEQLRPHLLRRALVVQLQDTTAELAEIMRCGASTRG